MGQKLAADESQPPPRSLIMELRCDCPKCFLDDASPLAYRMYIGHDYIEMRREATADGWRRADNRWLFGDHTA